MIITATSAYGMTVGLDTARAALEVSHNEGLRRLAEDEGTTESRARDGRECLTRNRRQAFVLNAGAAR